MTTPLIQTVNLQKSYNGKKALNKINLTIHQGEAVALIGANGAGKSTLITIILGLLHQDPPPDGGMCTVLGEDSKKLSAQNRSRIGCIADDTQPIPWASLHDLASLYTSLYPLWDKAQFDHLIQKWKLNGNATYESLSLGQKRLAEIALTVSFNPELIILDEPFNNLDPIMRQEAYTLLKQIRKKRIITIIYSTHLLAEVKNVAERIIILREGELVHDCNRDEEYEALFFETNDYRQEKMIL